MPSQAEQADGSVAESGYRLGRATGADPGTILVEGEFPHVVRGILHFPVAPQPSGDLLGGVASVTVRLVTA